MASRFLSRAAGAARSARGHRGPAPGLICTPPTASPLAVVGSLAGRVPAHQGLRHYGTPFNGYTNIAELNEALRKVEKRLGALEEKCDTKHKPSIKDTFNKSKPCSHRKDVGSLEEEMKDFKKEFGRFSNTIIFGGFGFTYVYLLSKIIF